MDEKSLLPAHTLMQDVQVTEDAFTFSSCPNDILEAIFSFLDRFTLIQITSVNKSWHTVAERQLSEELFQHYHTQTLDALKEGYLLNALCNWVESHQHDKGDVFSEEQQKSFLQQFNQAAWGIASDGSETPLQFITRVSDIFQQGYEHKGSEKYQAVRSQYLQKYLKKTPSQINFLFHTKNIQQFSKLYNHKTHMLFLIAKYEDQKFLAKFLAYIQDIESFLMTLIFSFDVAREIPATQASSVQRWQVLQRNYAKHTLRGDGMVALSTHAPSIVFDLLDKWNNPNDAYPPLSSDEVQFFFKKLLPADFIAYLNIMGLGLDKAIHNKQPQLIVLLSHGSVENDMALIHFCKKTTAKKFLEIIESVSELMSRIKDLLFLKSFLSATFIDASDKSWFVEEFLPHFTLPQLSLLCLHVEKRNLYQEDTYPNERNAVKKQFTKKLFNEPNDQHLIDALFACSFIDSFKNHLSSTFFLDRLGRIQSKAMQNYLSEQAMKFCTNTKDSEEEKIVKKQAVVFFLVRSKIFLQFDDKQLIWLADPSFYLLVRASDPKIVCFLDFLEPLFSTGRITKNLFLALTQVPHIGSSLRRLIREQREPFCTERYSCVKNNLTLAFEIVNYAVSYNEETPKFLAAFKNLIRQFPIEQRIHLLENTRNRKNRYFLKCVFSFEELRTLWRMTTTNVPDSFRKAFFVHRLSQEISTEKFAKEVIRYGIKNTKEWSQRYSFFSTRLKQADIYFFVFEKCVGLLATNHLKPLDRNTFNWLELLGFLQKLSPTHDAIKKRAVLRGYTAQQLYALCLQLQTKADNSTLKSLQKLFYPLCLNLLEIIDLQRLKQHFSPNTIKDYLFPNDFISSIENVLKEKVRAGKAATVGECLSYAIPSNERNWIFILLFLGLGGLIAGIVSGLGIIWMIALIPLLFGMGMTLVPICSALINRLTFSSDAQALDENSQPRQAIVAQNTSDQSENVLPEQYTELFGSQKPEASETNATSHSSEVVQNFSPTYSSASDANA